MDLWGSDLGAEQAWLGSGVGGRDVGTSCMGAVPLRSALMMTAKLPIDLSVTQVTQTQDENPAAFDLAALES